MLITCETKLIAHLLVTVLLLLSSSTLIAVIISGRVSAFAFAPPSASAPRHKLAPSARVSTAPARPSHAADRVRCAHEMDSRHARAPMAPRATGAGDGDGSDDDDLREVGPGIVVFSGGTAFNAAAAEMARRSVRRHGGDVALSGTDGGGRGDLADLMAAAAESVSGRVDALGAAPDGIKVWHVLPVTDDGGSTAEIVRVLGGPAVGDIRSRLLRLAPGTTREERAVRRLLGHRLASMQYPEGRVRTGSTDDDDNDSHNDGGGDGEVTHDTVSRRAREEWLDLLDGGHDSCSLSNDVDGEQHHEHPLWKGISSPYRSIIRSFLVHFHNQVLLTHNGVRPSPSHPPFDFTGGSVGNFFFAGARTFFGSLPAAIFLFSKVAGIPAGSRVLPATLSLEPDRLVLGAVLRDGTRVRGQYRISHPGGSAGRSGRHRPVVKASLAALHPAPIAAVRYLLYDPTWRRWEAAGGPSMTPVSPATPPWSDRHETSPAPNPDALAALAAAQCIVYGCGSLFTSVLPSLALTGVGAAVSCCDVPKVLLLNGWHDSETSWVESTGSREGERSVKRMDATAFVQAIVDALHYGGLHASVRQGSDPRPLVTDYVTHILYPTGTEVEINEQSLDDFCNHQRKHERITIKVMSISSIPANTCAERSRSGGLAHHRVFDPRALVDALLDLANRRSRL